MDGDGTFDGGMDTLSLSTTIAVADLNEAPAGQDKDATIDEDGSYIFGTADFPLTDNEGHNLLGVTIVTVPGNGTLLLDGVAVTSGDFVSATDLTAGDLTYVPDANENGLPHDTFTFAVRDDGGTLGGGIDQDQSPNTFTFNVSAVNDAPTLTGSALSAFVTEAGNAASSGETGRVNLFTGVTIADIDAVIADGITGAVVRISDDFQTGSTHQDFLRINGNASGTIAGSGIAYAYDPTTGAMVLTGAATVAEYKSAIELVQFSTSGDNVTAFGEAITRQVAVSVSDGLATAMKSSPPSPSLGSTTRRSTAAPRPSAPALSKTPPAFP